MENVTVYVGNTTDTPLLCNHYAGQVTKEKSIAIDCMVPVQGDYIKIYTGKNADETKTRILSLTDVSVKSIENAGI